MKTEKLKMGDSVWRSPENTRHAYIVPIPAGWLVYSAQTVCMAELTQEDGWTAEQAEDVRRLVDGEPIKRRIPFVLDPAARFQIRPDR